MYWATSKKKQTETSGKNQRNFLKAKVFLPGRIARLDTLVLFYKKLTSRIYCSTEV